MHIITVIRQCLSYPKFLQAIPSGWIKGIPSSAIYFELSLAEKLKKILNKLVTSWFRKNINFWKEVIYHSENILHMLDIDWLKSHPQLYIIPNPTFFDLFCIVPTCK
jgi:hypothetical protein